MGSKFKFRSLTRLSALFMSVVILSSFIVSAIPAPKAYAAGLDISVLSKDVTPEEQAASASYYQILIGCFWHSTDGKIKTSSYNPDPSTWFNKTGGGLSKDQRWAFLDGKIISCEETAKKALQLWGWGSEYGVFLNNAGCSYNGTDEFKCASDDKTRAHNFQSAVLKKAYPTKPSNDYNDVLAVTGAAEYARALATMNNACKLTDLGKMDALNAAADKTTATRVTKNYYVSQVNSATVYVNVNLADDVGFSLHGITYRAAFNANPTSVEDNSSGEQFAQQMKIGGSDNAEYPINTYGHINQSSLRMGEADHRIDNESLMRRCTELANTVSANAGAYAKYYQDFKTSTPTVKPGTGTTTPGSGGGGTTCAIPGIGWIICPVVNILGQVADSLYSFIESKLLPTNPEMLESGGSAYQAWLIMRNFANVAFVIAFMIVIFSQLSGYGIDNYGIKKLLPKIIIAALLVNLSFLICQIAVDVSNIIGYSLSRLLASLPTTAGASGFAAGTSFWGDIVGKVVATAAGAAIIWLNFSALVPILITGVIAMFGVMLILVARQAIIMMLIVISPIAFVLYLLPNTEKWFQKWKDVGISMLILYPTVALIYGMSKYAAGVIAGAFSDDTLGSIIGAAVLVMPLYTIPFVLKGALNSLGNVGAKINDWSGKAGTATSNKIMNDTLLGQALAQKQQNRIQRRAAAQGGHYTGSRLNPRNWHAVASSWANPLLGDVGQRRQSAAASMAAEQEAKDVAAAEATINSSADPVAEAAKQLRTGLETGNTTAARAAFRVLNANGGKGLEEAQKAIDAAENGGKTLDAATVAQVRKDVGAAGVKGKNAIMHNWAKGSTISAASSNPETFSSLTSEELIGQRPEALKLAQASGMIDSGRAMEMVSDAGLLAKMDPEVREILEDVATTPRP